MTDHSSYIYSPDADVPHDTASESDVHAAQTSFFPAVSGGTANATSFRQQRTGRPYPDAYYEPEPDYSSEYYRPNYYSQFVPVVPPRRPNPAITVVKVLFAFIALAMLGLLAFYATTIIRTTVNVNPTMATSTPVTVYPTYDSGNVQGTMTAAVVVVTYAPTQAPQTAPNLIATVTPMPSNTVAPANITVAATATRIATAPVVATATAVVTNTAIAPTETLPPLFTAAPATPAPVITLPPNPTSAPTTVQPKPTKTPEPTKAKPTKAAGPSPTIST